MTPRATAKDRPRGEVVKLPPALLRDVDAAAYLGRGKSWIRQLRGEDTKALREGRDPTGPKWITIGSSVFYRLQDLDHWITVNAQERGVVAFSNRGSGASRAEAAE